MSQPLVDVTLGLSQLIAQAARLSKSDRLELIASLEALNQAEADHESQDNRLTPRKDQLNHKGIRGGKGSFEDKYIKGYGPYRYLRYWYGKTHKSVYLGKVLPKTDT